MSFSPTKCSNDGLMRINVENIFTSYNEKNQAFSVFSKKSKPQKPLISFQFQSRFFLQITYKRDVDVYNLIRLKSKVAVSIFHFQLVFLVESVYLFNNNNSCPHPASFKFSVNRMTVRNN